MMRRALVALSLLASLLATPAFAQSSPIPALPDSERRTQYTITATTCACAVNFQLYGDQTDVDNWIQVWVNGTRYLSTDPTFGWVLSSPSGSLGTIPRPITDAIITFNNTQTGTVEIVGAQRPRRLSEFAENTGVPAHSVNLIWNTIFAEVREVWDKINDVTGRVLLTQPGNTMGPLPTPATCANMVLGFGSSGLTPTCVNIPGSGFGAIVVGVRSSAATTVTVSSTSDYFLCLDPTSNAITVNLPSSPQTGSNYLIKDCTGQSATHNITVTPASGNIDGNASFALNTAFQSIAVTYTGTQWSIN